MRDMDLTTPPTLPLAPLTAMLDHLGGIYAVITARRTDLTEDEGNTLAQRCRRQMERLAPDIEVYDADAVSIDALRLHPAEVWGQAWFELPDDEPEPRYCAGPECVAPMDDRAAWALYCGGTCQARAMRARRKAEALAGVA